MKIQQLQNLLKNDRSIIASVPVQRIKERQPYVSCAWQEKKKNPRQTKRTLKI